MRARRIAAFLALAREELAAAERLKDCLPRQAAYFLQQAVEKLVRALLEQEGVPAGTAHNLLYLAGLLPAGHALRAQVEALEHLSAASTRYRYPSPTGALARVSVEDVARDYAAVTVLQHDVEHWLADCRN